MVMKTCRAASVAAPESNQNQVAFDLGRPRRPPPKGVQVKALTGY
jgi:hypothetical protein